MDDRSDKKKRKCNHPRMPYTQQTKIENGKKYGEFKCTTCGHTIWKLIGTA